MIKNKLMIIILFYIILMILTFNVQGANIAKITKISERWEGEWNTDVGIMVLSQTGNNVTGSYEHNKGKIVGIVSDNILKGTWSESPSYSPPEHAGDIEFTLEGDSFIGKWRNGSSGDWFEYWTGTRSISTLTHDLTYDKSSQITPMATDTTPNPTNVPIKNIDAAKESPDMRFITTLSIILVIYILRRK